MSSITHALSISRESFAAELTCARAKHPDAATIHIPVAVRILQDQLTPVLAYRRLVREDHREAPSFLLESVENGTQQSRYSLMGNNPKWSIRAKANRVTKTDHASASEHNLAHNNPFDAIREIAQTISVYIPSPELTAFELPEEFLGGWVGFAGYDTVRYTEPGKLPFADAPADDRDLDDLQFSLYPTIVLFDHATKLVNIIHLATITNDEEPDDVFNRAVQTLDHAIARLRARDEFSSTELFDPSTLAPITSLPDGVESTLTKDQHADMVAQAKNYIEAGDIFQVVLGQRLDAKSNADPFDVYRALRVINPSPYMGYIQGPGLIMVAASPEILCKVRRVQEPDDTATLEITNRPLAGTRPRGQTPSHDAALECELLADPKERAEHVMLVDLGRNDVGRVAIPGSTTIERLMNIERYAHVMHISSTVTGTLTPGLDGWDALASTLPVGTISGAPKVRAMQIIDELEPVKRGPYGGGFGWAGLNGEMDLALTLRTIVVPTTQRSDNAWTYHFQASGGIVYDSDPAAEYQETLNKAASTLRAVQLAELWRDDSTQSSQ